MRRDKKTGDNWSSRKIHNSDEDNGDVNLRNKLTDRVGENDKWIYICVSWEVWQI